MLYMAVTADKYELPICVKDNVHDLAVWAGISDNTLSSNLSKNRSGKNRGYKFVKVGELNEET